MLKTIFIVPQKSSLWLYHVIYETCTARLTSKFIELWSPAQQHIWPWSRSKVTVKVKTWYIRKGLVTRNTHAKYQSSICNSAKVMAKVKVFVTDRRTDRQLRFNVPTLSRKRGTIRSIECEFYVAFTLFQSFWNLKAGDTQSLK